MDVASFRRTKKMYSPKENLAYEIEANPIEKRVGDEPANRPQKFGRIIEKGGIQGQRSVNPKRLYFGRVPGVHASWVGYVDLALAQESQAPNKNTTPTHNNPKAPTPIMMKGVGQQRIARRANERSPKP